MVRPPDTHYVTPKTCSGMFSLGLTFVPSVRGTKTISNRPYSDAQCNGVAWTPLHRASEKRLLKSCKLAVSFSLTLHWRDNPRPSNLVMSEKLTVRMTRLVCPCLFLELPRGNEWQGTENEWPLRLRSITRLESEKCGAREYKLVNQGQKGQDTDSDSTTSSAEPSEAVHATPQFDSRSNAVTSWIASVDMKDKLPNKRARHASMCVVH